MAKKNNVASSLGAATLGAAVGGVLALLFSPKSGKQNRKAIASETKKAVKTVKKTAAKAEKAAVSTVKKTVKTAKSKAKTAAKKQ